MKISVLLAAATAIATASPLAAQRPDDLVRMETRTRATTFTDPIPMPGPIAPASVQAIPLTLRNGAVPTGLSGFYDYQSNGMSPHWIEVDPVNPQVIHATYMLATDDLDSAAISRSRRVGYARSNDGGATWTVNADIGKLRLGFPYLELWSDGTPVIAAHGDPDAAGTRIMIYKADAPDATAFTRTAILPRRSAGNREGDGGTGVIWPAFEFDPRNIDEGVATFFGSLSPRSQGLNRAENPAPLQIILGDITTNPGGWIDFGDTLTTATSGGRYATAVSPLGKIGLVYHKFRTIGVTPAGDPNLDGEIYFSESTDGGESWSEPLKIFGGQFIDQFNLNDDRDTLTADSHVDIAYNGETANVVFTGSVNNLYRFQSIFWWTPNSNGWKQVAFANLERELGIATLTRTKNQPGTSGIAYPTISIADDGMHIVVAFMAMGQRLNGGQVGDLVQSEEGFGYHRVWMVGSPNAGQTWGDPFILQDWADDGEGNSDSASIEFPSANENARMVEGKFEHVMAFQARRSPGMYAFVASLSATEQADRGPINEVFQYFQKTLLDESYFTAIPTSVDRTMNNNARLAISANYPNPASSRLTVEYDLPTPGEVELSVHNVLGQRVLVPMESETGYAGTYSRTIDVASLPNGLYRIVLRHNGRSVSAPLNIVR